jgi:hypothetical protein
LTARRAKKATDTVKAFATLSADLFRRDQQSRRRGPAIAGRGLEQVVPGISARVPSVFREMEESRRIRKASPRRGSSA